jgi:formylglycine-generating enzyme required for sulfatase activity
MSNLLYLSVIEKEFVQMKTNLGIFVLLLCLLIPGTYAQKGDANDDKVIDSADVTTIIDHVLERSTAPGDGDVNSDSALGLTDAMLFADSINAPATLVYDLPGEVTMEMVRIPAGSFMMGAIDPWGPYSNEQPVHKVTFSITSAFYMSKYEVTEAHWEAFKAWPGPDPNLGANFPA